MEGLYELDLESSFLAFENPAREGFLFDREDSGLQGSTNAESGCGKARGHRIRNDLDKGTYGGIGIGSREAEEQNLKVADEMRDKRALSESNDSDSSGKRRKYGELISEIESAEGDDANLGAPARKAQREKKRRDRLNNCFATLAQLCTQEGQGITTDKLRIVNEAIRLITNMREAYNTLDEENARLRKDVQDLQQDKKDLRDEKKFLKAQLESYMHCYKLEEKRAGSENPAKRQAPQDGSPFFLNHEIDTSRDAKLRPPVA